MTNMAVGATAETEASEQAFYLRVDELYRVYENWTGDTDDGAQALSPGERRQSNGEKCIASVEALSTFLLFGARLAVDHEMSREDLVAAMGQMYDNAVSEDEDDADDGDEAADSEAPRTLS